jgi:hypothetical protein
MRFGAQAEAFLKFVQSARDRDFPPCREDVRKAAFLVLPWMETAVPWFSLAIALLYRARGFPVEIVYADTAAPNPGESAGQIPVIDRVLATLGPLLPVTRLSAQSKVELSTLDHAETQRLTELNAISYLRRTGQTGSDVLKNFCEALAENLRQIRPLFTAREFDHWMVPGGIYGVSGLCTYCGRVEGTRVATYDSGAGTTLVGVDGVAAHCADVAAIFRPEYAAYVETHRDEAIALAKKEFELRRGARDRYGYSVQAYEAGKPAEHCDVLFPLNMFDDAAGLGGHRFFASAVEWLRTTVGFVLGQTTATIVLREHPGARHVAWHDDTGDQLLASFPNEPRLRFVSCREKVSTYQLLESAKVVLPYSSTVGVEAAMLGKQVIVESSAYFADLGFVQQAASKADYLQRIQATLHGTQPLPEELREQAWLCYFYGQVANFVDTEFTPMPEDFAKWSRKSFQRLKQEPTVELIVETLSSGVPSCRLQSERIFAAQSAAPRRSFSGLRRLLGKTN